MRPTNDLYLPTPTFRPGMSVFGQAAGRTTGTSSTRKTLVVETSRTLDIEPQVSHAENPITVLAVCGLDGFMVE